MKKLFVLIVMLSLCIMLCATRMAFAGHYIIKLTNGKEIVVKKYWDDGKTIRFYMDGGAAGIAKKDIQAIVPLTDNAQPEIVGGQLITLPDNSSAEEDVREERTSPDPDQNSEKQQLELREKIAIIKTNIATLNERKNNLQNQRAVAFDAKLKAEEQLEKARSTPYMTTEDRKQAEESGQRKIIEAAERIKNFDQALADVEVLLGKQEALLKTLEERLP